MEIRQPGDILSRASRPQRNSSHTPKKRDWRYTMGVYRHEDFEGTRGEQTIWDRLDEDHTIGEFRRGRKRTKRQSAVEKGSGYYENVGMGGEEEEDGSEDGDVDTPLVLYTPSPSMKRKGTGGILKKDISKSRDGIMRVENITDTGQRKSHQDGLIACLKYPKKMVHKIRNIFERLPTPESMVPMTLSPSSPTKPMWFKQRRAFISFEGPWIDETTNFSMKRVKANLQNSVTQPGKIPQRYAWFPEAVPIDAIFPPGVPLSGKEINAFYPHHVRQTGVAVRFLNNGYKCSDIMNIQAWFRSGKARMSGESLFNTLWSIVPRAQDPEMEDESKLIRDLSMEGFEPDQFTAVRGSTVPNFDDLLSGLKYLPTGLDARELTYCLVWYLNHRDMFTPPLEVNVLHTQSLIRALRLPLRPYGNRNLDMMALKEWKQRGRYSEHEVADEREQFKYSVRHDAMPKSQLKLHPANQTVSLHLNFPIRNILTFPFLAMITMAGEGVRMGLEKTMERKEKHKMNKARRGRISPYRMQNTSSEAFVPSEPHQVAVPQVSWDTSKIPRSTTGIAVNSG